MEKNEVEIPYDFLNDGSRDVSGILVSFNQQDIPNKRLIVRGLLPTTTPSSIYLFFKSDDFVQVESISDLGFAFLLYKSVKLAASFLGYYLQSGIEIKIDGTPCKLSYAHQSAFVSVGFDEYFILSNHSFEYWDQNAVLKIWPLSLKRGADELEQSGSRADEIKMMYMDRAGKCCLLCRRKFRFIETLERHFVDGESEMHTGNLLLLNQDQ
jgi:hypothetical protein